MEKKWNVAVVGATGAVGQTMVATLVSRRFPFRDLKLLASSRSAGQSLDIPGQSLKVEELQGDSFYGVDIALFSAGGAVSRQWAPVAVKSGAVVVDNTSAFRMDPDVPLVVPEVNPGDLSQFGRKGIIANPNCSTIQMVVALKPLHDIFRIRRIVVSTYQAVSGAGRRALAELAAQQRALALGEPLPPPGVFPHAVAESCLPHIGAFTPDGHTEEELKMINETRKIMGEAAMKVAATCVRVPVGYSHGESVNVEFEKDFTLNEVKSLWQETPGLIILDDPAANQYPLQGEARGMDPVFVGRLKRDFSVPHGLSFWCVSDNLVKGAALNAVQIAEILIHSHLKS